MKKKQVVIRKLAFQTCDLQSAIIILKRKKNFSSRHAACISSK